jgi:hypothetical protein
MRLKVRLQFVEPWSSILPEVAKQCKMTVDDYCRRAVQLVTKQGLEEGERQNEPGITDLTGDGIEVRPGPTIDSNALANSANP